jgi:hypothetical protein
MRISHHDDYITVVAAFKGNKIIPLQFVWKKKQYKGFTLAASWQIYWGEGKRIFFTLDQDGEYVYEVFLDTNDFRWTMNRIFNNWL